MSCRDKRQAYNKKRALQPLDPNVPSKKRAKRSVNTPAKAPPVLPPSVILESRPEPSILLLDLPKLALETTIPLSLFLQSPLQPSLQSLPPGFLYTNK